MFNLRVLVSVSRDDVTNKTIGYVVFTLYIVYIYISLVCHQTNEYNFIDSDNYLLNWQTSHATV